MRENAGFRLEAAGDRPRRPRPRPSGSLRGVPLALLLLILPGDIGWAGSPPSRGDLLIVVGSPGEPEYGAIFQEWAANWRRAGAEGGLATQVLGEAGTPATSEGVANALASAAKETELPLWVVLIGHGTFDGRAAKFNLSGPDLSAETLAASLDNLTRPLAVINCSSASGPFLAALSGPGRVIITATRSGAEVNFARFGGFLSEAVADVSADLDKDGQVSLLEAFLSASRRTEEFYVSSGRLATEHALLDDNGDGRGTGAAAYRGIRPVAEPKEPGVLLDGHVAHQWHLVPNEQDQQLSPEIIARRNELELELARLRQRKSEMAEKDYYAAVEEIFVALARLTAE